MQTEEITRHYQIKPCEFAETLPFWRDQLWQGRQSVIEPVSAIAPSGQIDLRWREAQPLFWKVEMGHETVGVVSGLFLKGESVRLRGLWVSPAYRGLNLGASLVAGVVSCARGQGYSLIWTMARREAAPFYLKCGFIVEGLVEGYEFGPHVKMSRRISQTSPAV